MTTIRYSGQGALRPLPLPKEDTSNRRLELYPTPPRLKEDRKSLSSAGSSGIDVLKVSKTGKLQARRLALSSDNRSILVTTKRIRSVKGFFKYAIPQAREVSAKGIDVSTILRVQQGQETNRFFTARALDGLPSRGDDDKHRKVWKGKGSNCLSIVYRASAESSPHSLETLDLVVPNEQDYEFLVRTLDEVLAIYWEERLRTDGRWLCLQYHWIEMGKDLSSRMSLSEWISLCERMNASLKKPILTAMYNEYQIWTNKQQDEGLAIREVAELLNQVREREMLAMGVQEVAHPFDALWDEMVATDPVPSTPVSSGADAELEIVVSGDDEEQTVSAVAFLSFVRAKQKEFSASLEQVLDVIHGLNRQITTESDGSSDDRAREPPKDRLSKSRFLLYLMSDSNDLMNPQLGATGVQDMTHPLSHYWINTSHDTYLAKLPNSVSASSSAVEYAAIRHFATDVQSYMTALHRGVRALELDTWDGVYGGPVVARRRPSSTEHGIAFSDVLRVVRRFLISQTDSFPVILLIENHCSLESQELLATQLNEILASDDLLYVPSNLKNTTHATPLPSPDSLRGKVIIKSKRPRHMKEGATVMNDDFDADLDVKADEVEHDAAIGGDDEHGRDEFDEEDEFSGIVVGFNATGPVKTNSTVLDRPSPASLLAAATKEANQSRWESERAARKASDLKIAAADAERLAAELATKAGLTPAQVRARARAQKEEEECEGTEIELDKFKRTLDDSPTDSSARRSVVEGEGLEVHDFLEGAINDARFSYSAADKEAMAAAEKEILAKEEFNKAETEFKEAEEALEASKSREKELKEAARRAESEARSNREHAETARRRVETVKELLRNCKDGFSSAETVVVTAVTESKISEQRAAETESRAARALVTAEKDRARADVETSREEELEHEAATLHAAYMEATREARATRERMEKAASMLDRVNEQIKLIEGSSQFRKEVRESSSAGEETSEGSRPRHVTNFMAKHAAKLEERRECTEALRISSSENAAADSKRRQLQAKFEEKASAWKTQAEIASKARKQADRSSHVAEDLAERAEEEREAATLRHIAREKAQKNVEQSDLYRASVQAQLAEAERASSEAARLAADSRIRAETLSRDAADARDHSVLSKRVKECEITRDVALRKLELATSVRAVAEVKAEDAKRLLDTSSEVFSTAKRDASEEIHKANMQAQAENDAANAYNNAILLRKQSEEAASESAKAASSALESAAALKQALTYKNKMDKLSPVSLALASTTFLHSCKHRSWAKSFNLPSTYIHSFSQEVLLRRLSAEETGDKDALVQFCQNHISRTFPPWNPTKDASFLNNNPIDQWGAGCQLVSMNLHAKDEFLLLNDGRFRQNGSCGYVLKPSYLVDSNTKKDREQMWTFQILAGSCLPKPEIGGKKALPLGGSSHIHPYVVVSLFDGAIGDGKEVYKTLAAKRNGLNPVWHDEKAFEVCVKKPAVSMLLFSVWDDGSGDFIAAAAFPVSCLRQGYRSIALFDSLHTRCGPYAFASLFVHAVKQ